MVFSTHLFIFYYLSIFLAVYYLLPFFMWTQSENPFIYFQF